MRALTQTYQELPYTHWTEHKAAIDQAAQALAVEIAHRNIDLIFCHTETYASSLLAQRLGILCVPVIHGVFPPEEELLAGGQTVVRHYQDIRAGIAQMDCPTVYVSFSLFRPQDADTCRAMRLALRYSICRWNPIGRSRSVSMLPLFTCVFM